jgi:NAD(P)-dependent dehydrogenase (short-subunit alcohol dehydrogenase family)
MIRKGIESGAMDAVFQNTPISRPATVEEIADSILFMVSPMSSYMCGTALVVDGGFTA